LLERQEWNTKLSRGLIAGDRFAHKTGDTDEVSHDGGILLTADGERYVVIVYSASASCEATDERFAALMRALRSSLQTHRHAAT
ncbi:MAG: serine hydrolase, partial [Vulcanimicrobiaceae bacterium]